MRRALYILGMLDDDELDWIVAAGRPLPLAAQQCLIREGQAIDAMYLVLEGVLAVSVESRGGLEVARLGPGEMLGEISMLDSRPPTATVAAVEDSLVLRIPLSQLRSKLETDHGFAAHFYRALATFLAQRLRSTVAQLGYGEVGHTDDPGDSADEIDPELLDTISLAGKRFEWILNRLRGS